MKFSIQRLAVAIGCVSAVVLTTGCASLTGLGGTAEFKCMAPEGVQCQSLSGVYYNGEQGNLPAQRRGRQSARNEEGDITVSAVDSASTGVGGQFSQSSGMKLADVGVRTGFGAIRSDPTVIRVWVAPWEDSDGDLNDETYIYLPVDSGRWLIEHNRRQIRQAFAPVQAPGQGVGAVKAPSSNQAEGPMQSIAGGMSQDSMQLPAGLKALSNAMTKEAR
jgi:conjugal transfer pilus assembly protein TraV